MKLKTNEAHINLTSVLDLSDTNDIFIMSQVDSIINNHSKKFPTKNMKRFFIIENSMTLSPF